MRIAIKTEDPLPDYKCWYAFEEDRVTTVASLAKQINAELDLVDQSAELLLLHDGYAFLSSSLVKGLIREDNLITIRKIAPLKQLKKESKPSKEKRKRETEKKKAEAATPKEKRREVGKKKAEEAAKKEKKRETEKKERRKDKHKKEPKQEPPKKRKATVTEKENDQRSKKVKTLPQPPSSPIKPNDHVAVMQQQQQQQHQDSGLESQPTLSRTQKRNRRKALKKKLDREEASTVTSTQEQKEKEVSVAPSEQLLKKNKNKKKDFLKGMAKTPRAHVRFDGMAADKADDPISLEEQEQEQEQENMHGAAYVTVVETDPSYDGEQKNWAQYPVHQVKPHFYADTPPPVEDQVLTEVEEKQVVPPPVVIREYETLPIVSLSGPSVPEVGDLLAIKTLSMTEFYTPEISDWKEVKVLSVQEEGGESVITVEYQPGFLLKKAQGRFELPDEDEEEDEEEGQENEYAKNQTRTYSASDLVDMRKI